MRAIGFFSVLIFLWPFPTDVEHISSLNQESKVSWFYSLPGSLASFPGVLANKNNIDIDQLKQSEWFTTLHGMHSDDHFGHSVASAGDVNGDGYPDVIVGDIGASGGGAAYLYLGSSAGLSSTPSVTLKGFNALDMFGDCVASAGDVNGDGYSDVIVGAPGFSFNTGAAYVFLGSRTGLSPAPSVTLKGLNSNEYFGSSVAGAGDVNGDGYSDVIVGAYGVSVNNKGAAYVFLGSKTGLSSRASVTLKGLNSFDKLGNSVAAAGDINGDGFSDVIIGAPGVSGKGAAYVFLGSKTGLSSVASFILNGLNKYDLFGYCVSGAGDINGDGYGDLIVGAPGVYNTGAVYAFLGSKTGLSPVASVTLNGLHPGDSFGNCIACAGDINKDGYSDVIVGNGDGSYKGSAYVYYGNKTGFSSEASVTLNSLNSKDYFVNSVSGTGYINQDNYGGVIVGISGVYNHSGAAYIYSGSKSGLSSTASVTLKGLK